MPSDYARIEQIIRYLDQHHQHQPSLQTLADLVDLSPSHFQRLFTRWAGISPKTFLQYVTASHVRQRLQQSESLLDTALESGLSGTGRLYDLTLKVYGMTPGEAKASAQGLTFQFGVVDSPFGWALLVTAPRGLCALRFLPSRVEAEAAVFDVQQQWPGACFEEDAAAIEALAQRLFAGPGSKGVISLCLQGTPFQLKVWEALVHIPEGAVVSYGRLAAAVGDPKASRAVGSAVGANPVAFLIPCHRVIRQTGAFNQYRWGATRKKALLGWEAARQAVNHSAATLDRDV